MDVGTLIKTLQAFDPDLKVTCFCNDDELFAGGSALFQISGAKRTDAEPVRLNDGRLHVKFEKSAHSEPMVILEAMLQH
jgi:hypothetical protein